jgi:hypothetical protein
MNDCEVCGSPLPLLPFNYGCDVCCPDDAQGVRNDE